MKVLSVVGARPQLVKLAPVAQAFAGTGHQHVIVHTGQHYDVNLSDVFFTGLGIPSPDVHLGVGSGSHGTQTGAVLGAMDPVLELERPDWVLVYGDTNSTLAGAIAAVKMHIPVAHLEAGLRSFNRRMPEEHNRVLTDHAADLLLAPTEEAVRHLTNEGLAARTRLVSALAQLPVPVALLAHPRLVARAEAQGLKLDRGAVQVGQPLPYAAMVAAVLGSAGVVTDSGGLQKEAYLLGRPCTTLRGETEWVETLAGGWNALVPDPAALGESWPDIATRPAPGGDRGSPYGDGHAAQRVVAALEAAA